MHIIPTGRTSRTLDSDACSTNVYATMLMPCAREKRFAKTARQVTLLKALYIFKIYRLIYIQLGLVKEVSFNFRIEMGISEY